MSRINRVEVQEFAFELPDLGFDAGGFNIVYQPKNRLKTVEVRHRDRGGRRHAR